MHDEGYSNLFQYFCRGFYRKIKHFLDRGLKFNELVVFIDISDIQDEAIYYQMALNKTVKSNREEIDEKEKVEKKASLNYKVMKVIKRNFIVTYVISKKIKDSMRETRFSRFHNKRSRWTIDEKFFFEYGNEGLEKSEFYMNQLYYLLKKNNIPLTIAVYPWPVQIVNNDLNSVQVKFWKKWAQLKKVSFLNYFPCFINKSSQSQASSFDTLKKYFIDGDVHWNEKGHELIANDFISFYSRQNGKCAERA